MSRFLFISLLCFSSFCNIICQRDVNLCPQDTVASDRLPEMPKQLFIQYETRGQDGTGVTDGAEMYTESEDASDAWIYAHMGSKGQYIVDPVNNEVHQIYFRADPFSNTSCVTRDIETFKASSLTQSFAWRRLVKNLTSEYRRPLGPVGIWYLDINVQKLGDKQLIRGYPATQYTYCTYFPSVGAGKPALTIRITWYVWEFGLLNDFTPAATKLEVSRAAGSDLIRANYITEFIFFIRRLAVNAMNKVASPYICWNRKTNNKVTFPTPPDTFAYHMEDIAIDYSIPDIPKYSLAYQREIFDFPKNHSALSFVDQRDPFTRDMFFASNEVFRLHDFKQGLSFRYDSRYGNCSYTPLGNAGQSGNDVAIGSRPSSVRMMRPREYFRSGAQWFYNGHRAGRGMVSQSWITSRRYPKEDKYSVPSNMEMFMAPVSGVINGQNPYNTFYPLEETTTIQRASSRIVFKQQMFAFQTKTIKFPDVGSCYAWTEEQHFVLKFNVDNNGGFIYRNVFLSNLVTELMATMKVSSHRLSNFLVEYTDALYATFTVLNRATTSSDVDGLYQPTLQEAVTYLTDAVNGRRFSVVVPGQSNPFDGPRVYVDGGDLLGLQRRTPLEWFSGYPWWAMLLMVVLVIIFGLGVGGGGAYFYYVYQ